MRITVLGCGTSTGVPRIGNDWGSCDPDDSRNRRSRSSIHVAHEGFGLLIDTSPDMREQLLATGITDVDAVVWTHDHADHCHGIDDLRQLFHRRRKPIEGYGAETTLAALTRRFDYVFGGNRGYPATCIPRPLPADTMIGPFRVRSVEQPHGAATSTGMRITVGEYSLGYAIDFNAINDEMVALYDHCDLLIVDALRHEPHPTHADLAMSMELAARCCARRVLLSHMDISMDYATLNRSLPDHVRPAYDGLIVELVTRI